MSKQGTNIPDPTPVDTGQGRRRGAEDDVVLEAAGIRKTFRIPGNRFGRRSTLLALDDVSIRLKRGEIVALIGESGSGKSTLARVLAQLERQDAGTLILHGEEVRVRTKPQHRRHVQQVQLMFQDPFASLNPMRSVYDHVSRPLRLRGYPARGPKTNEHVLDLLREVHLTPPRHVAARFPHELSGGQRQRVSIARALAAEPAVVLADEPISMLDVSMRLGILNVLRKIVTDRAVAMLYITHDIASARYFAARGVVMYAGQVVEEGTCREITQTPANPYTRLLVASAPDIKASRTPPLDAGSGEPPNLADLPKGCRFAPRCPHVMERCAKQVPPLIPLGRPGRTARCWLYEPSAGAGMPSQDAPVGAAAESPAEVRTMQQDPTEKLEDRQ